LFISSLWLFRTDIPYYTGYCLKPQVLRSELSIIPSTTKPSDLKIDDIKTAADADVALLWLRDVLIDMAQQIKDRGTGDEVWLLKIRAAERATKNLVHRVLEKRSQLTDTGTVKDAIYSAVAGLDPEAQTAIVEAAIKANPHLGALMHGLFPSH
jgi:hypothetical protein